MPHYLRVDDKQIEAISLALAAYPQKIKRTIVAAINDTAMTGRTYVVRRLAEHASIKQKRIREVMKIRKANFDDLSATISVRPSSIPLYDYSPSPSRPTKGRPKVAGVSVNVRGKRETLKGTFIAQMKSGHLGIYERSSRRSGKSGRRIYKLVDGKLKQSSELPIKERFGPTPAGVLANAPAITEQVLSELEAVLQKNINSQIDRTLGGK